MSDGEPAQRVLVVNEDTDLLEEMSRSLGRHQAVEVVASAGPPDALAASAQDQPDVVVVDVPIADLARSALLPELRRVVPGSRVVLGSSDAPGTSSESAVRRFDRLADVIGRGEVWPHLATLPLDAHPSSPARARAFVRDRLQAWDLPSRLVDDAALVTSELVTNAVRHVGTSCVLQVCAREGSARVEVHDRSTTGPQPRPPGDELPGGRGLPIVSSLAVAWGIDPAGTGKAVWAELDV